MNENRTPLFPDDLEKELNDHYSSSEPRPEFVARLERGLHSKLKEQGQKKMIGKSAKLKRGFAFAFAAVLIGLLVTSPTVVTAMKRLFGYIPGVGLVDTSNTLRVLAGTVSQTRDGITITVEEAVLSSDHTVILFTVENIPPDKLALLTTNTPGWCGMGPSRSAELRLPDGAVQQINGEIREGWGSGYRDRFTYAPIPADVNQATLMIPCIRGTLPGMLPENWELPLQFVPAPDGMTALPVVEYTPLFEPNAGNTAPNPITITKTIDLEDSYILIGDFAPPIPTGSSTTSPLNSMSLTDGSGQQVNWEYPQDIDQPAPSSDQPFVEAWSIKVAKGFAPPLNIKYSSRYSHPASSAIPLEFEFDAGENPQPGDEWQLNREFNMDGHAFTLTTIEAVTWPCHLASGYGFTFNSPDTSISLVTVSGIDDHTPVSDQGGCASGGGETDAGMGSTWTTSLGFAEMPKGKLKVKLSIELYSEPQEWMLQWQPEAASNLVVPKEMPQACLTIDSWKTAMANPMPVPSDLSGKLIAYGRILEDGRDPSPENSGLYVMNLDGSNKQVIGQGNAASLSTDGTQAVYDEWEGGLFLTDLASGEKHHIPNTAAHDHGPRWSPDGKQVAFMHYEDIQRGIVSVSIINPDGTGLQRITSGIIGLLISWTSDGTGLLYGEVTKDGMSLKKLEIASGATGDLFAIHNLLTNRSYDVTFDISPDGNNITFFDQVSDSLPDGLYISNLDGSDRKLMASQSQPWVFTPIWSPDGKWLIAGVWDNSPARPKFALVNVQDCRIAPLPWWDDAERVYTWIP